MSVSLVMVTFPSFADQPTGVDRPVATQLTPSTEQSPAVPLQAPAPRLTQRPAFWVGLGVVVLSVVASSVVVATVVRPPPSTSLTPEQVCNGPCNGFLNAPR
jgi:hypothetical protein